MGKHIDKRLSELGGSRCIDIHCADEATNMEEVIEAWFEHTKIHNFFRSFFYITLYIVGKLLLSH